MIPGEVALVTDSAADLGNLAAANGITVVPLSVSFGPAQFRDGIDMTDQQFYARLQSDAHHPTTAQPAPGVFAQTYKTLLDAGATRVISMHLSGALSGTYNAAVLAAGQVAPDKIRVIDTRWVSAGLGLLVMGAAQAAARGESVEQIVASVSDEANRMQLYAAIPTLTYLARGGRIGQLRGLLGNVLKIVPIVTLTDGEVTEYAKVRTFARAVDQVVQIVTSRLESKGRARCAVMHAVAPQLAADVGQRVRQAAEPSFMMTCCAGPTVGTHTGPGAVGVFFIP